MAAWVAGRPKGSRRLVAAASHRPEFSAKNLPQSNLDAPTVNFPLVPETNSLQFLFCLWVHLVYKLKDSPHPFQSDDVNLCWLTETLVRSGDSFSEFELCLVNGETLKKKKTSLVIW